MSTTDLEIANRVPFHVFTAPDGEVTAVSARDLHAFLEIGKVFGAWIKVQVERAGLIESEDYVIEDASLSQEGKRDEGQIWGGQNRRDWFLTLDAAKHIAAMSSTEKGRLYRQFLIARDKELWRMQQGGKPALPDFSDPVIAARAWADEVEARRKVEGDLAIAAPKAQAWDHLMNSDGLYGLQVAGRIMEIGPNRFCQWLVDRDFCFRMKDGGLMPHARWRERGLFSVKLVLAESGKSYPQTFITPAGLTHFHPLVGEQ